MDRGPRSVTTGQQSRNSHNNNSGYRRDDRRRDNNNNPSSNPSSSSHRRQQDRGDKKKEAILDLAKYMDKRIHIKFAGGREVIGILKGYDPLLNIVLDDTEEFLRDPEDSSIVYLDKKRPLGLVVCRGTTIVLVSPEDGREQIANPFLQG